MDEDRSGGSGSSGSDRNSDALQALASQVLSMLAASDEDRKLLVQHSQAASRQTIVAQVLREFDVSRTGQLEAPEAHRFLTTLAKQLLHEAARGTGAAAAHAQNLLLAEDSCDAANKQQLCSSIEEMAGHLLRIADTDSDGVLSLSELAELFDGSALPGVDSADGALAVLSDRPSQLELYELRGSLQLLPRIARHFEKDQLRGEEWHADVAGDSHTMMRWVAPTHARDSLSIVGLGRSADASCYYLPEWGLVLDAGLATKAFTPRCVLLSHGHRDHTQALPVLARPAPFAKQRKHPPKVLLPTELEPLVRSFLLSESVLNFGHAQTASENEKALGQLDLHGVADGDIVELPAHAHAGKRSLSVEVFAAPHKEMPSVAFGIFRNVKKLKPQYADQADRIGDLMRQQPGLQVSELVQERMLFYSGDTTIDLLRERAEEILPYPYIIHEVTFLGPPSAELDEYARKRGHTHYAQIHPFIAKAPHSIFILVHWSIRYSRQDVETFFEEQYGGVPRNVVLWVN